MISFIQKSGKITYCGHEFSEFVPQRTCAYISQHDLHDGEMTVRETLDFSGRCMGVGTRYEMLAELTRREKEAGIKPDPELDAFMKAASVSGQKSSLVTDYVLKVLLSCLKFSKVIFLKYVDLEGGKLTFVARITASWIRRMLRYCGRQRNEKGHIRRTKETSDYR